MNPHAKLLQPNLPTFASNILFNILCMPVC